jgi:hypothetical protein
MNNKNKNAVTAAIANQLDCDMKVARVLVGAVDHVAKELSANKYRRCIDREDLEQDLIVWMLDVGRREVEWRLSRDEAHWVRKQLWVVGKEICEKASGQWSGYDADNLPWYTPENLAKLMPLALNDVVETATPVKAGDDANLIDMISSVRHVLSKHATREGGWDLKTDAGRNNLNWLADRLGGSYPSSAGNLRETRVAVSNAKAIAKLGSYEEHDWLYL